MRNQHAVWELAGRQIPDNMYEVSRETMHLFQKAVVSQSDMDHCAELSSRAITKAFDAAEILTQAYVQQRLAVRRQRSLNLPVSIGCELGFRRPRESWDEQFREAFGAAVVPVEWRHIEPKEGKYNWEINDAQVDWCLRNRLMIVGGPLFDLSANGVPEWLQPWAGDVLNLQSFVSDFVETAISRYVGRIRHWEVVARGNTGGALSLNEESRLALAARILEVARKVDEEIQLIVRVDQPWGEYQSRGQHLLSPLQFVDALVRSGVGLSAVNLEIAVGYRPNGTASRDLHDFSRIIDRWSCLGIPLNVTLAFPSAPKPVNGRSPNNVGVDCWKLPFSSEAQAQWIDQFLPLLMAKDTVTGVYWAALSDMPGQRYPHCGLLTSEGEAKPALREIVKYRRTYWQSGSAAV